MAEVKWIKICTDIFDDEKISLIEDMPDGDSIIVIWFKLLCLAGKQNNGGILMLNDRIAYTDKMLSTIFRKNLTKIQFALTTFQKFGMIKIVEDTITIPNWEKHQNAEKLKEIREYNRIAKQRSRERAKQKLLMDVNDENLTSQGSHETDIDKDKDKDIYKYIKDIFNETCVSFPKIKTLSESRKKAIKARLNTYTVDDFKIIFEKAENSDFLKGKNNRNWIATFDWLIKDANFAKVLDGNYDKKSKVYSNSETSYDMKKISAKINNFD